MGLTRDAALVTTAAEAELVLGPTALANLEVDGGPTVEDRLLAAHQAVFDELLGHGRYTVAQLATITNESALANAVIYRFGEGLAAAGLLGGGGGGGERAADEGQRDYFAGKAQKIIDSFRPAFPDTDLARNTSEGLPVVKNLTSRSAGPFFNARL